MNRALALVLLFGVVFANATGNMESSDYNSVITLFKMNKDFIQGLMKEQGFDDTFALNQGKVYGVEEDNMYPMLVTYHMATNVEYYPIPGVEFLHTPKMTSMGITFIIPQVTRSGDSKTYSLVGRMISSKALKWDPLDISGRLNSLLFELFGYKDESAKVQWIPEPTDAATSVAPYYTTFSASQTLGTSVMVNMAMTEFAWKKYEDVSSRALVQALKDFETNPFITQKFFNKSQHACQNWDFGVESAQFMEISFGWDTNTKYFPSNYLDYQYVDGLWTITKFSAGAQADC